MELEDAMIWGIVATAPLFVLLLIIGTPLFLALFLALAGGVGTTIYVYRKRNAKP
ncbi:hypothetical protein [Truepera radiovictrix]|uniref:Uncharacterized protein n=1 Tax=Truepera radiovictrix (strain DSM 17093 / CIP 108686 / LMG 22925 / RQ-24) TaxID=649638 RepID=D7CWY0_TRURR|nr:hypothetical protein [Truepera radiovictrix]ADI14488.1 hypothetical protein Trad_1366 [Truepera radiovictrix DSM 17093]WMT56959.1 hypothetical protein RCV51_13185 [Truepera radiovictrix]